MIPSCILELIPLKSCGKANSRFTGQDELRNIRYQLPNLNEENRRRTFARVSGGSWTFVLIYKLEVISSPCLQISSIVPWQKRDKTMHLGKLHAYAMLERASMSRVSPAKIGTHGGLWEYHGKPASFEESETTQSRGHSRRFVGRDRLPLILIMILPFGLIFQSIWLHSKHIITSNGQLN